MSYWDLDLQRGWRVGLALAAALVLAAVLAFLGVFRLPLGGLTFLLGLVGTAALAGVGLVGYVLAHSVRAEYGLDRNGLLVRWGGYTELIPLPAIHAVETELPLSWARGLRWPGLAWGWAHDAAGQPVRCYATGLQGTLVLRTAQGAYALTPKDREAFLEGLQQRLEMGPTQELEPQRAHPRFLDWSFWHDTQGLIFFWSGALLSLALAGVLYLIYPLLPATLPLRVTAQGAGMLQQMRENLFRFPLAGALVWTGHVGLGLLLYRRERFATLLLWGVTLVVEVALWGALIATVLQTL